MPAVVAICLLSNGLFDGVVFGKILSLLAMPLAPREVPSLASCPVAKGKTAVCGGGGGGGGGRLLTGIVHLLLAVGRCCSQGLCTSLGSESLHSQCKNSSCITDVGISRRCQPSAVFG